VSSNSAGEDARRSIIFIFRKDARFETADQVTAVARIRVTALLRIKPFCSYQGTAFRRAVSRPESNRLWARFMQRQSGIFSMTFNDRRFTRITRTWSEEIPQLAVNERKNEEP
jgi:hypothetical protein